MGRASIATFGFCCMSLIGACTAPPRCLEGEKKECACPAGSVGEQVCKGGSLSACACEPLIDPHDLIPTDAEVMTTFSPRGLSNAGLSRQWIGDFARLLRAGDFVDAIVRCDPQSERIDRVWLVQGESQARSQLVVIEGRRLEAVSLLDCLERQPYEEKSSKLAFDGQSWHGGEEPLGARVLDRRTVVLVTDGWREEVESRAVEPREGRRWGRPDEFADPSAPVWGLAKSADLIQGGFTIRVGERIDGHAKMRFTEPEIAGNLDLEDLAPSMRTALAQIITPSSAESLELRSNPDGSVEAELSVTLDDADKLARQIADTVDPG
jgi:hypothetical protein